MIQAKKGFEQWWLVMMIFAIMTLIVIFPFFSRLIDSGDSSKEKACALMFSQGLSSEAFYTDTSENFNQKFFDFTEENCKSFELEVTNKDQNAIVNEINSCWKTLNSGKVVLPKEMYGEGLCYYCGGLKVDTSFDFDKLQNTLHENSKEGISISKSTKITSKEVGIFYYQYREEIGVVDTIGSFLDSSINQYGGMFVNSVDLFNPEVNMYSGITLAEIRERKVKNGTLKEFYLGGTPLNEKLNCITIVPNN